MPQVILTDKEKLDILHIALCGAGHLYHGAAGIDYEESDFDKTRSFLTDPCLEDVWLRMVIDGLPLYIVDYEDDSRHLITIDKLNNLNNIPFNVIQNLLSENYDGEDGDYVLEYIMYNEKIYG